MSKTAVVVMSDPNSGGEGALGRLFNALFLLLELSRSEAEVALSSRPQGPAGPPGSSNVTIRPIHFTAQCKTG
jgi:hypothetical protein